VPRLHRYLDDALVQPMGIDVERFAALARHEVARPDARAAGRRRTILVVARLVPIKGVDVALAAYGRLATTADLVIAGDGPERARLEALATTAAPALRFLGAVDATARDQVLRDADVVVIPSRVLPNGRSEGSPMIALEALAAGVPVVASAVGGLRDLPGITLVPPDDPGALAAAIDRVLAAPPPRVDISQLDWRHVSARLLDHAR
jgi:glycosyltransferase involved in cell wall biosynthesis